MPAKKLNIVGVIPARLDSERLPGKVLRPICGKAMLHHVYDGARGCELLDELWIATDSDEVKGYCDQHGIPVLLTAATHRSGTERIHEVMQKREADVFLNIQGDEPLISSLHVRLLIEPFLANPFCQVTTLKVRIDSAQASNPNVVKVVADSNTRALYFSRTRIPYYRDASSTPVFFKHLGLYGYRREALARYFALPPSPLETAERLEQMRFLENDISIYVVETEHDTIGVDTESDLQEAIRRLGERSAEADG